jgi:hypothetical protein
MNSDYDWAAALDMFRGMIAACGFAQPPVCQLAEYGGVLSIDCDGYLLYRADAPGGIGFAVDVAIHVPGCHTMPNGDPGYPDDVDVVTIYGPVESFQGADIVNGVRVKRENPATLRRACLFIIHRIIDDRLEGWAEAQHDPLDAVDYLDQR